MKRKDTNYTIVRFQLKKALEINFTEYSVLDIMIRFSKKNEFREGTTGISNRIKKSRKTVIDALKILLQKGYISRDISRNKSYYLNYEVKELFEELDGLYVKIYHNHRKELNMIESHYVFLYMIYSLSKNRKSKIALAKREYFCEFIGMSESNFDTMKSELTKKGFLERQVNLSLKLDSKIFDWFEGNN